jgi:hypothetical protein
MREGSEHVAKLNQIVAAEKGQSTRINASITKTYHELQKSQLFSGFTKVYQPKDEDGERFPNERVIVQGNVETSLDAIVEQLSKLIDVTLTKDVANTHAVGRVIVDGDILLSAPVPFLLFMQKQLIDFRTVLGKLPVLDPAEVWNFDHASNLYRTEPAKSTKTRKVPEVIVKYPATDKHPAQVDMYMKDEVIGHWETTKLSGAITVKRRDDLLNRVNVLLDAVKYAVEEANQHEVTQLTFGQALFDHLLEH